MPMEVDTPSLSSPGLLTQDVTAASLGTHNVQPSDSKLSSPSGLLTQDVTAASLGTRNAQPSDSNADAVVQNLGLRPVLVTRPVSQKVANAGDMLSAVRQSLFPGAAVPITVDPNQSTSSPTDANSGA